MAILRVKQEDGTWAEIPAIVGEKGADGYTPQKGIDYFDGAPGADGSPGKDGTSVSVSSVSESTEDGGSNVVTFSDGKTMIVKNGSKGNTGDAGSDGAAGVGVVSVEQTTTSTTDDGNNVITVTLTDGTKSTFVVQNGSKGSTGESGYTPVKGIDYFDGQDGSNGADGADGTSVFVQSVSESTEDGGSNVVTFSDGKTMTVKNGSKGSQGVQGETGGTGADGKSAYQYAQDGGYTGTEEEFAAKLVTAYLPLAGGTMTGDIIIPNNRYVQGENGGGFRTNSGALVLHANAHKVVIRPQASLVSNFGVAFDNTGTVAPESANEVSLGASGRQFLNLYLSGVLSDGTNSISVANIANKNDVPSTTETWTFTLEDGTTVTKAVYVG